MAFFRVVVNDFCPTTLTNVEGLYFLAVTFFIGDSSLYNRYKHDEKIRSLENEINRYKKEIEQNKKKIQGLQTDKVGLEQFAREEYFMKKADEDIFIIEE